MSDMATMPISDLIREIREQLKNSNDIMKVMVVGTMCNRMQEQVDLIAEIREAFKDYRKAEGCGCCSDYDAHKEAAERLGKLLNFKPYSDGSGYDFYERENDD